MRKSKQSAGAKLCAELGHVKPSIVLEWEKALHVQGTGLQERLVTRFTARLVGCVRCGAARKIRVRAAAR